MISAFQAIRDPGRRPARRGTSARQEASAVDRAVRRALAGWGLLVAVSFAAGGVLHALGVLRIDHFPPFHAQFRVLTVSLLPAAVFGVAAVRILPRLTARVRFGWALAAGYACALAWTVLLAVSGDGLAAPFTHPQEYPAVLPAVGDDPLAWLAGFTTNLPAYPTHVRGHPPLPVLVVWALRAAGLGGPLWAAVVVVLVGCSATVAIALTVRRLSGDDDARRVLPYLALAPASVWIATSMDGFFAGVGAWGVALLVLGRGRAGRLVYGAAAGLLLGALPYLSYGLVPYLLIAVAVAAVVRPPKGALVAAVAGAAAVTLAFAAAGFLWPAGVLATHAQWAADPGAARPYLYFLVADFGVLALVTGPATAAGLVTLARLVRSVRLSGLGSLSGPALLSGLRAPSGPARLDGRVPARVAVPVAAALAAVLALDLSGITRGEVERIWVPYALWICLAAAFADRLPGRVSGRISGRAPDGPGSGRGGLEPAAYGGPWLMAQMITGLLLQGLIASPW
ncbi:hypothetical protein JOL79_31075 [Microbispora sp. RL4-1S]|uniref:Uncharacterized protein n=1 Tax=Microbispora oryzae TaxID=2806554 RepID=A0A940WVW0_9ACTN|nr:hypothetical protein [Microbispora oryzae]MBP2708231.1 hypothetical protein [Microbispora oryzae]